MKLKRFGAYIIDMLIVHLIASFIVIIPIFHYNLEAHQEITLEYLDSIMYSGSTDLSMEDEMSLAFEFIQCGIPISVVTVLVMFLYLGIGAFLAKGSTLGKKIMAIKIVPVNGDNLNPSLFILRQILLYGIVFKIASIVITLACTTADTWFSLYNTLSNLSSIVTFVILGFMIIRDDERGLHDLLGQTKVVSIKEK